MTTETYRRVDTRQLTSGRIGYLELRPHCDVLYISGRDVPLFSLTQDAELGRVDYATGLLEISDRVATARFGFDIGSEGAYAGRVDVKSGDLLAIARLSQRFDLRQTHGGASA